ncbi:MAG: diguanylate cyclase domain-containing protein, partial [Wenzhouxiangella sp.]
MTNRGLSLRHTIPLVILVLGLVALGTAHVLNTRHLVDQLERNAELSMRTLANVTAGTVEAAYRGDDADQARAAIERLAGHRRIRHALIVELDGTVEHATRVSWLGAALSTLDHGIPADLSEHIDTQRSARLVFSADRSALHGAFPVRIRGAATQAFVPEARAWLLMAFDLAPARQALYREALTRLATLGVLLLAGCAALYLFLRRTVLDRIARLRKATRAVSRGEFGIGPEIEGSDEIAELAEDFRIMTHDLQRYQERMKVVGLRDPHTGLHNRQGIERRLAEVLAGIHDEQDAWLLCNFDVEGMKVLNSTRGHAAGDALLQQVADHLEETFTGDDIPARIVGDEFALLVALQGRSAEEMARRILASLESLRFEWKGSSQPVRFNLGAVRIDSSIA